MYTDSPVKCMLMSDSYDITTLANIDKCTLTGSRTRGDMVIIMPYTWYRYSSTTSYITLIDMLYT